MKETFEKEMGLCFWHLQQQSGLARIRLRPLWLVLYEYVALWHKRADRVRIGSSQALFEQVPGKLEA